MTKSIKRLRRISRLNSDNNGLVITLKKSDNLQKKFYSLKKTSKRLVSGKERKKRLQTLEKIPLCFLCNKEKEVFSSL